MKCSKYDEQQPNFKGVVKHKFHQDLELCKSNFETFLRDIHTDYRYLGIMIMEAYIRCTIDFHEKEVMLRPNYTFEDLSHFFEISRASKGLRKLLQFCFTQVSSDQKDVITVVENLDYYRFKSKHTLQSIDEIVDLLKSELAACGGVGAPDLTPERDYLTDEDREQFQLQKEARKVALEAKAVEGRYKAVERVEEHIKQVSLVWWCGVV